MELSNLVFTATTTDLERASKVIAGLVTDVSKLDKASRDAAKTEEILAKAAKLNADAHLQNAKAQDVRLKSTIAADKADKVNEQAVVKKTKAIEKETEATAKNVGVLQKQKDILEFQTQGYSKGQAGILAYGKAAGLAASDIAELGKVLETQRKLMGGDPFDKSLSGIKSLQNQYTELKESLRQYNTDSELSAKQTRELARDKERLIEKMKVEGASFQDIRKAVRAHNDEYVSLAGQYNKLSSAEDAVVKSRKEMVQATNYLTTADQKMAAALSTTNAALDKAGTDSLVKYEQALRKSGVSQDVATAKLAKYKVELAQVQNQEQKRREQHLARAISPQITDIGVSLYSGQAPLTVLLQQSGQLLDLFTLSGVEVDKFGETMKRSFYSMVPAIGTVAKGMAGLVGGLFIDAGKGITNFVGNITGITLAMESTKRMIASGGEENFKYIASLQKIGSVASTVTAAGLAAVLLVLVAMAVEYKNIVKAEGELSKALATSGGAIGLSKDQAVAYAESMQAVGVGTLKAMNAITEFTKVGKIGKEGLDGLIKSAINLEKYAGVPIEETAKKFAKLQDEPTKALIEFTEANGQVSKSVLDVVASLEQQGDKSKAVEAATRAMEAANNSMAEEAKANLSPIETLWNDIKSAIGRVKQEIYDLTTSNDAIGAMRTVWETISVVVAEVWFTLKGVGTEIRGIAAQLVAVMQGDFQGAKNIGDMMKADAATARAEQDKLVQSILNRGQAEKKVFNDSKEQNSQYAAWRKDNEKALEKQYSKSERLAQKEKQLQADVTAGIIDETKATQALAGWKRIIMGEDKKPKVARQGIKDLETEIDILNKRAGLTSSYNNELASLQRLRSKGLITEQEYVHDVEELIKLQPFYIKQQKDINDAHELSNSLLGKQDMLGKDYYKRLEQIDKYQKMGVENGGYSVEHAEKLRQAAFDQTELAKTRLKIEQDSAKLAEKYRDDIEKAQNASTLETANLDDRLALLGLTSEQQKNLRIEQDRRNKLLAIALKLQTQEQEVWDKWGNGEFGVDGATKAKAVIKELTEQAGVDMQNVNKETAVKFREDFDAELKQIKSGVTDSIVTALFEGGKAGSKKLRDVLVSVLRQKVTMVVDVGVNAFMNSMMGGFFGGGGSGAGGGAGGAMSMLSNGFILYNAGSQAYTLGSQYLSGTMAGSNVLGSVFANATGTGIDGLLATNGAFGTAPGAAGGAGMSALAGAGAFAAVALAIGNAMGVFRSDRRNGGGIAGTLGSGDLYAWEERRYGGTLFDGPDFDTQNLTAAYKERQRVRAENEAKVAAGGSIGYGESSYMDYLDKEYEQYVKDAEVLSKTLQTAFGAMRKSAGSMAATLGLSKDAVMSFTTSLGGEKGLNFDGLDANGQQKLVAQALATANNEIAQQLIGTWEKFTVLTTTPTGYGSGEEGQMVQSWDTIATSSNTTRYVTSEYAKEGEKAIDTLTRLAGRLSSVNTAFDTLGYTLYDASLAGGDMASKLVDLFGNLETFTASASSYYQNFYKEAEKQETMVRQLTKAFGEYNLELPSTRDAFRQIVERQNLTTEAGREMFKNLMALQNPLNELFKTFENLENSVVELSNTVLDEVRRLRGLTDSTSSVGGIAKLEQQFLQTANKAKGGDLTAFEDLAKQSQVLDQSYLSSAGTAAEYELRKAMLVKTLLETDSALRSGTTSAYTPSTLIPAQILTSPTSTSSVASQQTAAGTNLIVLELQALRGDVDLLRAEVRADVTHNAKTAKILERVTPGGDALATRNEG